MGEPPLPCCDSYGRRTFQSTAPSGESAAVPSAPKCTKIRPPAAIGVGDARLFFGLGESPLAVRKTSTSTTLLPVSTSNASARSDAPLPLRTAVVSHKRPPTTIGVDHPRPGTACFQTTLEVSLQVRGRPVASE